MSRFEFLLVLVSIIVALALSDVIAAWGRMLRNRKTVPPYWLHTLWLILAFLILTEVWWVLWELQGQVEWTYGNFLIVLVAPTFAVLAVETITPTETDLENTSDLRSFYFESAPQFFRLAVLFECALIGQNVWFFGLRPWILTVQTIATLVAVVLATTRNPKVHERVSLVVPGIFLVLAVLRFRV